MPQIIMDVARIVQISFSLLASIGILIAFLSWRSKQSMDQRKEAISYSLTKNPDYFKARGALEERFKAHFRSRSRAPSSAVLSDPEVLRQTKIVLADWETMAISIFDGILDERTCFEMVATTLVNTVEVLRDFIDELRQDPVNARRYDYLLILTEEWKKRLEKKAAAGPISRYEEFVAGGRNIRAFRRSLAMDKQDW